MPAYLGTAEDDNAVALRSLGTEEEAIDAEVLKLAKGDAGAAGGTAEQRSRAEKRYYYNPSASPLTAALRDCIENCRCAQDGAAEVLDSLVARPGYPLPTWGEAESRGALELADQIDDTIKALQALVTKLPATATAAAAADDAGENSNDTATKRSATAKAAPLLAARAPLV